MFFKRLKLHAGGILTLFLILIVFFPVWSVKWLHGGDMPAHLYCANIFNQLLLNGESVFEQFFELNIKPVPNTLLQLFISFLLAVVSPHLTIKIVASLVIIVFCSGYFSLISAITDKKNKYPFLIFLLIFCYPFIMGLYSYMLSLGLMMFCVRFYLIKNKQWDRINLLKFMILITMTWFTHFFGFAATLLFIFIYELVNVFNSKNDFNPKKILGRISVWLIAIFPALVFTLVFGSKALGANPVKFLSFQTLAELLINLNVLNCFGVSFDERLIFYVKILLGILFSGILLSSPSIIKNNVLITLIAVIVACTFLYFLLPYEFFAGGFINIRIMLLLLLMVFLFVDSLPLSRILTGIKVTGVLLICVLASDSHLKSFRKLDREINELYSATNHISEGKIVLPLNYSSVGLHYNFALYLSVDKNIMLLDNPEALSPNSLVRWRTTEVFKNIGNYAYSNRPLLEIEAYQKNKFFKVDYVTRWKWEPAYNDTSTQFTNQVLDTMFEKVFVSNRGKMQVFKQKE